MADDTMDDLIAGKKARLKKSLSSCSTWMEVKENEDKHCQRHNGPRVLTL